MSGTLQSRRFLVSGVVQGVGYRYFAMNAASRTGVSGYARNLRDGRVEVFATGTDEQLKAMRRELETGPRFASVSDVLEENAPDDPRYSNNFVIEH